MENFLSLISFLRENYHLDAVMAVIGVLAILAFIASLFVTWGSGQEKMRPTSPLEVSTPEFLKALSRLTGTYPEEGSPVKVLNNGEEFLPALLIALNNAKNSINFTTYIWEEGKFSKKVFDSLINAAKRGVEVRLIEDAFAGRAPKKDIKALEDAGGKIKMFHTFLGAKITRFHKRNHRRAIVVDGNIGYIGGMAVSDKWLGKGKIKEDWRDMMFEVSGNMAESLQSAFTDMWTEITGEVLVGEKFYPLIDNYKKGVAENKSIFLHTVSVPTVEAEPVRDFFYLSVLGSKKTLYIMNPYLLPDPALLHAIQDKAKSGVDVRILLPGINDSRVVRWASQINYSSLLKSGVKIYEYQPTMMHIKTLVSDGSWSVLGSANMDSRSRILNNENLMGIVDQSLAKELNNNFFENLKYSKEITNGTQNLFQYLRSKISGLFAKQY